MGLGVRWSQHLLEVLTLVLRAVFRTKISMGGSALAHPTHPLTPYPRLSPHQTSTPVRWGDSSYRIVVKTG